MAFTEWGPESTALLSPELDDTLRVKLAIEPTEATEESLNELAGLTSSMSEAIARAAEQYRAQSGVATSMRQVLDEINADAERARANAELAAAMAARAAETNRERARTGRRDGQPEQPPAGTERGTSDDTRRSENQQHTSDKQPGMQAGSPHAGDKQADEAAKARQQADEQARRLERLRDAIVWDADERRSRDQHTRAALADLAKTRDTDSGEADGGDDSGARPLGLAATPAVLAALRHGDSSDDAKPREAARRAGDDPISRLGDRMERALNANASYVSLHARGMDTSREAVRHVAREAGGDIRRALPDTVARENGGTLSQLSQVVGQLGDDVRTMARRQPRSPGPRIMEDAPESTRAVLAGQAPVPGGESARPAGDDTHPAERPGRAARPGRETTGPQGEPAPQGERGPRGRSGAAIAAARLASETRTPRPAKPSVSRETLARRIESMAPRVRGGHAINLRTTLANLGERTETIGETIATVGPNTDSDTGIPAGAGAGLVRAGAARAGTSGLAGAGGAVANVGRGLAGAATRAAVPLAIATTAWKGLEAGANFYTGTQQSGFAEGETGWEAFETGLSNNLKDWVKGLNPLDRNSSDDYKKYRQLALQTGYGYDASQTSDFQDAAAALNNRGLDPRLAGRLFGRQLATGEGDTFRRRISEGQSVAEAAQDADGAKKELDKLAESAKEAGVSLETMAEATASLKETFETMGAVEGGEALETSREIVEDLSGEGGIFNKETGLLRGANDQQKAKFIQNVFDIETNQGMLMVRAISDQYATQLEKAGINMGDPESIIAWAQENLDPGELSALMEQVATDGTENMDNKTLYRKRVEQNTGGIRPATGDDDAIRTARERSAANREDREEAERSGKRYATGTLGDFYESHMKQVSGKIKENKSGTQKGSVQLDIKLDNGLIANVKNKTNFMDVIAGRASYEGQQTGQGKDT